MISIVEGHEATVKSRQPPVRAHSNGQMPHQVEAATLYRSKEPDASNRSGFAQQVTEATRLTRWQLVPNFHMLQASQVPWTA